jgi:hypothetical protein
MKLDHQVLLLAASSIARRGGCSSVSPTFVVNMKTRPRSSSSANGVQTVKPSNKSTIKTKSFKPKNTPKKETTAKKDGPWYTMFTKGDEEYDQYMATEWGFEKVGFHFFFCRIKSISRAYNISHCILF